MGHSSQKSLGYALSQLNRLWNQRFMEKLRAQGYYNLKPSFCVVFIPLFENDGQSASDLAREAKISKQTMSIYAHELRQRGYIKMVQDTTDKRVYRIFLTAKGSLLHKVFESTQHSISQELCGHLLASEAAELSRILEKCFK